MSESDVGNGPNPLYGGCFEGETQELADLRRSQAAQIAALTAERAALRADAERLHIRGTAYEAALGIAYQATYQSHHGHWDKTGQHGAGCPECIRAREARENCDAELRRGLEALAAHTPTPTKEPT